MCGAWISAVTVAVVATADAWIDLLLKRSAELRRAGILSIGCDGNSAVLAPAEPEDVPLTAAEAAAAAKAGLEREPSDPWENPASYPTGDVPSLEFDPNEQLPDIPTFGDD